MKMPVASIRHGGGPWPFVDIGLPKLDVDALADYLRSVRQLPPEPPRALLVVSRHWEAAVPTVMTSSHPPNRQRDDLSQPASVPRSAGDPVGRGLRRVATGHDDAGLADRRARFVDWERAPAARTAHPREEHPIPLLVAAGAAGDERAVLGYNGTFAECRLSAFHFGAA